MHTIFYNAEIETFDSQKSTAQAMSVEDGLIKYIGSNEEVLQYKSDRTAFVDLGGKFVMPGFNDPHIHIWKVGDLKTFIADLRDVRSIEEMLQRLLEFSRQNPHLEWIMARGFNEVLLKENRMPTRYDLDQVFPQKPVYLIRTCAHIAVVNSKALSIAGITEKAPVPVGGEVLLGDDKKINGIFTETAKGLITPFLPQYTEQAYRKMISAACLELLSLGITSATDPAVMPDLLSVYKQLDEEKKMPLRIHAIPIGIPDGGETPLAFPKKHHSDFLTIDTIKFFADGGLSGQTAAIYKPYKNTTNNYGVLRLNYEMFYPIALEARQNGWRIATHAIGDKAIDEVLRVYEQIQKNVDSAICNRIEHLGIVSEEQMQRIKKLNIAIVTQPIFIKELGKNFRNALESDYLQMCYPFKSMFKHKLKVAFSTDAPVVKEINPLVGIQTAIDRRDDACSMLNIEEQVDIRTATKAYTLGGAIAQQEDHIKGSLAFNKYADFIVLDRNILNPAFAKSIIDTKVLATYVGGNCLYRRS